MKKMILIIAVILFFYTGANSAVFSPKKGGNCYTLDIPDYMVRTYQLNDVASLQYQNTLKEAYTIVIDDSKEQLNSLGILFESVSEFLVSFTSSYMVEVENRELSKVVEFKSNGNNHAQQELRWRSDGNDFFMLITTVETGGNYYKILSWTLAEYKNTLYEDFVKISKSLKE